MIFQQSKILGPMTQLLLVSSHYVEKPLL